MKSVANGASMANGNSYANGNSPYTAPWRFVPGGNPNWTHWDWTIGRDPA